MVTVVNAVKEPWDGDIVVFEEPLGPSHWAPANNTYAASQANILVNGGWFWHSSMTNTNPQSVSYVVYDHLNVLESRYTNFILNVSPNRQGELDPNVVNRLAEIGAAWSPNAARPPLPPQPTMMEHPITANSASASSGNGNYVIDGSLGNPAPGGITETAWQSSVSLPQTVTLDLGYTYNNINMLNYLPSNDLTGGMITSYSLSASQDGKTSHVPIANSSLLQTAS
ncbi:hypothetical protein BC351_18680 [Paenibacillus ferrarius]|uniref:F5/8 type C domain-containing protein n=1 Tax=Paenibacillus ferrarius TaxID=1469647 RepID=A0A1V4HPC3_9BACL|nr:discoidin domain-containing protein [Paenibacillus ferrarius]OPH59950.1 hypothetical protein BC351_18680 [Paenibacillus ferrarius]